MMRMRPKAPAGASGVPIPANGLPGRAEVEAQALHVRQRERAPLVVEPPLGQVAQRVGAVRVVLRRVGGVAHADRVDHDGEDALEFL